MEPIGMVISIGGNLPADLVPQLLRKIEVDLTEIIGPTSAAELRKEIQDKAPISWTAVSHYGNCENLKAFCRKHGLGYIHTREAKDDCNGEVSHWVPGMKTEIIHSANQGGDIVVHLHQIKPIVELLLDYAKQGDKALPLHINDDNEDVQEIIEKSLKHPRKFLPEMEKMIKAFLPTLPELPPFTIKE